VNVVIAVAVFAVALGLRRRIHGPPRPAPPATAAAPRTTPDESSWATLLATTAAEVRSGNSLRVAFANASREVALTGRVLGPTTSLGLMPALTSPDPAEAVVIHTLTVAATLGGPTATVLESGASLLRERAAVRAEATVHAAQARLSARVLTATPLLFAGWSLAASPSFRAAVFSPAGSVAVVTGMVCNATGWWWMRHIVAEALR
jgi:hypothetical protein